jgi:hypothetical protein
MIIVIRREDESVAIMRLLPIAAVRLADGKRFTIPKVVYSDDRKTVQLTLAVDDSPAAIMTVPATMLDSGDPVDGWQLEFSDPKREIERWRLSLGPQEPRDVSFRAMPCSAIPQDRSFRDAWCDVTPEPVIDIDMDKARAIHKDRLRVLRKPLLAGLDIEYQRADERGNKTKKKKIVALKKELRDVTDDPAILAAKTPDELKAVWPVSL